MALVCPHQVEQLEDLLAPLLCGSFGSLVQQQEYAAAGSKPPPQGKLLGPPAAPGSATVTRRPTGITYAVTAEARKMFKGKTPASIAEWLAMKLQEENIGIRKKYQVRGAGLGKHGGSPAFSVLTEGSGAAHIV